MTQILGNLADSSNKPSDVSPTAGSYFFDQLLGKSILAVYLFGSALAWCCVRSHYLNEGSTNLGQSAIPLEVRLLVMLALIVPTLIVLRKDLQTAWLVGLSVAVGTVPLLPLLPFLQDYTHLVILLWIAVLSSSFFEEKPPDRAPIFIKCFMAFVAICIFSGVTNYLIFRNVWQLKVGVTFVVQYGAFALLLFAIAVQPCRAKLRFNALLDGFVWGVFAQALVALVAIPLLFYFPYSQGNDTIFGIAYYDRYKSFLSGPVPLGMFFLISLPLVLLWMQRCRSGLQWIAMAYLQLLPWLMTATGSRTARVMAVGTVGLLVATPKTRRATLSILPSFAVAYWIGFTYQSFPSAIYSLLGNKASASNNLSNRYFDVADRIELSKETIQAMDHSSLFSQLFGFGPGVGGYRISGFPEPHNMIMNQWVQTGAVSLLLLLGFLAALSLTLWRQGIARQCGSLIAWLLLVTLVSFESVNGTYDPTRWGTTMFVFLLGVCGVTAINTDNVHRSAVDKAGSVAASSAILANHTNAANRSLA